MPQLIQFTLRRGPTVQTEMSLVTTGNHYDISASFRCDGRLFHSPGLAALNALSPKLLYVRVTTHVRLAVSV